MQWFYCTLKKSHRSLQGQSAQKAVSLCLRTSLVALVRLSSAGVFQLESGFQSLLSTLFPSCCCRPEGLLRRVCTPQSPVSASLL